MRLDEDIIRFLTIKIKSINDNPSPFMTNKPDKKKDEAIFDDSDATLDTEKQKEV